MRLLGGENHVAASADFVHIGAVSDDVVGSGFGRELVLADGAEIHGQLVRFA